jgi:hypothetical protein
MLTRGVERHFGRAVRIFDRLAAGCLRTQPAGGEGNRRLGSQKSVRINLQCPLLFPFAVTSRHFRDVRINQRIDSLPCPALSSIFPGRLACFLHRRGFTKLRRSACAGSNYVWIMRGQVECGREVECEVIEKEGNGGKGESVTARAEKQLAHRWTQINTDKRKSAICVHLCLSVGQFN